MVAHASYVNSCTGLSLNSEDVSTLLQRMSHHTTIDPKDTDSIKVSIPCTRPDILHECDIMEDAAIAYGFNNLPDKFPATSTVAQPLAISKLSDIIRKEWALAGWVEVLPLILVSIVYQKVVILPMILPSARMKKTLDGSIMKMITTLQSKLQIPNLWSSRSCAPR